MEAQLLSTSEIANNIFYSKGDRQPRLLYLSSSLKSAVDFSGPSHFPSLPLKKRSPARSISPFFRGRLVLPPATAPQSASSPNAQMGLGIRKAQRWWEKGLQPNMKEVVGAQDLVDSLLNAEDKLVVVDFFSPGCGGCKALHPKICQLAELNPDLQFLQVNYEQHKSMCYTLNVHVLPFFRLYKGARGRICSFSCTNATIKKFKDALAKYGADCCSLGPTKGLEEKELVALAANRDLSFNYTPTTEPHVAIPEQEEILAKPPKLSPYPDLGLPLPLPHPFTSTASLNVVQETENKPLPSCGR